jgi:predicted kinase
MKLFVLNGCSCAGKTTILEKIMKEKDGYFHLGYDPIKWQFSRYVSGMYTDDIYEIMTATLTVLCQQKHNVVLEAYYKEPRLRLIALAKQHGYEVIEVNLEAEWDVLVKRFEERMVKVAADPHIKIANRTKERLKELFDIYENGKNPEAIVVRTDNQTVEEAAKKVLSLL